MVLAFDEDLLLHLRATLLISLSVVVRPGILSLFEPGIKLYSSRKNKIPRKMRGICTVLRRAAFYAGGGLSPSYLLWYNSGDIISDILQGS
jgi:hypothetical protein